MTAHTMTTEKDIRVDEETKAKYLSAGALQLLELQRALMVCEFLSLEILKRDKTILSERKRTADLQFQIDTRAVNDSILAAEKTAGKQSISFAAVQSEAARVAGVDVARFTYDPQTGLIHQGEPDNGNA